MTTDLTGLTITEAAGLLRRREISSRELTQAHLDRIREVDPKVRAYITVTADLALAQAEEADRRIAAGEATSLTGVPAG
ncbi:MAG TPA: amidase family protein, partial [Dehalococcoidia bacterium]|nr:amidase family protein [Dehalococcoidia bacterium]